MSLSFKAEFRPLAGESAASMEARASAVLDLMDQLPPPDETRYVLVENAEYAEDGWYRFSLILEYKPKT